MEKREEVVVKQFTILIVLRYLLWKNEFSCTKKVEHSLFASCDGLRCIIGSQGIHLTTDNASKNVLASKQKNNHSHKAVFLNLIAVGMGQAYNYQIIKGIVFFVTFIILLILVGINTFVAEKIAWIIWVYYGIILIDGYRNAFTARRRMLAQVRMKELQAKTKQLLQYRVRVNDHKFAVDTNILMHEPDLLVYLLENESIDLYMSMTVFNELDGLKNNDNPVTRKKAQIAFDVIEEFQRRNKLHILKTPKMEEIRRYGLSGSPDEKIIGTYLHQLHHGHDKLMFLSNDKGARIIARNVGMPVVEV